MKLCFTPSAWEDYLWFQENNRKLLKRINLLIRDTLRSPYEGIGKPEPSRLTWRATGLAGSPTSTAWSTRRRQTS